MPPTTFPKAAGEPFSPTGAVAPPGPPAKAGLAARPGPGPGVKLERVSLPAPSASCWDQLSPSNPHCNPSCPPVCGLGQLLESQGFAGLSVLISRVQLPQTAGLGGRWGREVEDFGSFGTVGIAACNSLLCCPFPPQAVLQKPILPASKVPVPFPAPSPHRRSPPAAVIVIIYAPKHPLSSAGGRIQRESLLRICASAGQRIPPSEKWCGGI